MKIPKRRKTLKQRVWDNVMTIPWSGCWIWMGRDNSHGYGRMKVGSKVNGTIRYIAAHRIAYEAFVGPIPQGLELDHLCCEKFCCNPDHLDPVTPKINTQRYYQKQYDGQLKGAQWKNGLCRNNLHTMTEDNIAIDISGKRRCRECYRIKERRKRERKRNKKIVDRSI